MNIKNIDSIHVITRVYKRGGRNKVGKIWYMHILRSNRIPFYVVGKMILIPSGKRLKKELKMFLEEHERSKLLRTQTI